MKKLFLALILAASVSTLQSYAQLGGAMNKAKNAATKKADSPSDNKEAKPKTETAPATETKAAEKPAPAPKKEVVLGKWSDTPAGMKNPALESEGLKLVNEKATRENWKEKYTKAIIVSKDWEIEKNEVTDRIVCRKIYMKLYGSWPDGKCKSVDFGFKQDYAGGSTYSKTLNYNGIGDMTQIVCE